MGLLTSSIGYGSLTLANFPGLQQIALFSVTGLLTAYLTVVCLLPWLGRFSSRQSNPWSTLCEVWLKLFQSGFQKPRTRYILVTLILAVIAIGLPQLHTNDNIRLLQQNQPQLEAEQKQIQAILDNDVTSQFFLVSANSKAALLDQLDSLCLQLDQAVKQGWLDQYQSICSQLPGPQQQQRNFQQVKRAFDSASGPVYQYLRQIASQEQIDKWREQLAQQPDDYTVEQWQANPMSSALQHFWLGRIQDQYVSWIQLSGIHQMDQLKALASHSSNWRFVNQVDDISQLFKRYRTVAVELLLSAYILIVCILAWRYGFKGMLLILLPPAGSIVLTLSLLGLSGSLFNFFNIFALLVVLGIGIDYALFFRESDKQAQATTLLAVSLSALTTLLAFGLLSLSNTPVIHSFGLTLLLGILFCFLLAPLVTIGHHNKKGITDE
jgi:predicted exporter